MLPELIRRNVNGATRTGDGFARGTENGDRFDLARADEVLDSGFRSFLGNKHSEPPLRADDHPEGRSDIAPPIDESGCGGLLDSPVLHELPTTDCERAAE